jgi:hypothetical protein
LARFDFLGRVVSPFRKGVGPLIKKRTEDEIMAAVIERIPVEEEPLLPEDADKSMKREDEIRRLLTRLEPLFKDSGITTDEMLRNYGRPLNAIVLLKFAERFKKKPSDTIKSRLVNLGFLHLQNNVWVLPPSRTPQDLKTQEDIKLWTRQTLTKSLTKDYQFVMPFVALVDLRKVVAEKHRVVKLPMGRTIFSIMDRKDLLPPSFIYDYMKRRGFSLEDMIRGSDIVFLASAFADPETLDVLREKKVEVNRQIRKLMGTDGLSLSYIADLHEKELASALKGFVQHPAEVAQRLGLEAQYWQRFIERESEAPGTKKPTTPTE